MNLNEKMGLRNSFFFAVSDFCGNSNYRELPKKVLRERNYQELFRYYFSRCAKPSGGAKKSAEFSVFFTL